MKAFHHGIAQMPSMDVELDGIGGYSSSISGREAAEGEGAGDRGMHFPTVSLGAFSKVA